MELGPKYERIKDLRWQHHRIIVCAQLGSDGKPDGQPCVLIADMSEPLREAVEHWWSDVCLYRSRATHSYAAKDIERFLAWDREMRGGPDRY